MNIDWNRVQKILEWVKSQIYLDAISNNAKTRIVKRGQVYRCNFGCGIGSEMQKERPAVVIQNDPNNKSSGNTIVIPITHDTSTMSCMAPITTQYDASGNVILDGKANTSKGQCTKNLLSLLTFSLFVAYNVNYKETLSRSGGVLILIQRKGASE